MTLPAGGTVEDEGWKNGKRLEYNSISIEILSFEHQHSP